MARIDRRASGLRCASGSPPLATAACGSGATSDSSDAKVAVSGTSSTLAVVSESVAASISAGCSSSDGPKCRGSDSSSFAVACLGDAVVSAATAGGCHGPVNVGGGGDTGVVVTGGVTEPPLAGAGGVQPVAGAGSTFCWTIFSRFSKTLKLNRRRFGFPRRPASWEGGSPLVGSTPAGLPKGGMAPGIVGIPGGALKGAGAAGPLEAAG